MHERDLDLIAALVEGRLDDESEARALVDSSPEHRAEYEAQKLAYDTLAGVGPAHMTDTEKAALHRDVWTELRAAPTSAPSRSPWFYRWIPAAAGMFVVVGLVGVLAQGGGSEDAGDPVAALSSPTTTSADSVEEGADGGATAGEADMDTMAESATTTMAASERGVTADELAFFSTEAEKVRTGDLGSEWALAGATSNDESTAMDSCLEAAGLGDYETVGTRDASTTETTDAQQAPPTRRLVGVIAAIPAGSDLSEATVAFVDPETCQVIHVDE